MFTNLTKLHLRDKTTVIPHHQFPQIIQFVQITRNICLQLCSYFSHMPGKTDSFRVRVAYVRIGASACVRACACAPGT